MTEWNAPLGWRISEKLCPRQIDEDMSDMYLRVSLLKRLEATPGQLKPEPIHLSAERPQTEMLEYLAFVNVAAIVCKPFAVLKGDTKHALVAVAGVNSRVPTIETVAVPTLRSMSIKPVRATPNIFRREQG